MNLKHQIALIGPARNVFQMSLTSLCHKIFLIHNHFVNFTMECYIRLQFVGKKFDDDIKQFSWVIIAAEKISFFVKIEIRMGDFSLWSCVNKLASFKN